jgi:glyoxalase family protein
MRLAALVRRCGLSVDGPYDRHYFTSIYFNDPDGVIIEIATRGPGWSVDEDAEKIGQKYLEPPAEMLIRNRDEGRITNTTWPKAVPHISTDMALAQGMHHITAIGTDIERTNAFFEGILDLRRVKMTSNFDDPTSAHWYWGSGDGQPGTLITYFERSPSNARYRPVHLGVGQTHHYAFSVADEETQLIFREKLIRSGVRCSPVMDRIYFKSIYTNDPDGHIVELATAGPGFLVDEEKSKLGSALMLPPWLEVSRVQIENSLSPIVVKKPGPGR